MNFREQIKELCSLRGLTQKDLADKLGITDISLNKTLRGKYPQLQTLERIATVLDVPITELFERKTENEFYCPKCGTKLEVVNREKK